MDIGDFVHLTTTHTADGRYEWVCAACGETEVTHHPGLCTHCGAHYQARGAEWNVHDKNGAITHWGVEVVQVGAQPDGISDDQIEAALDDLWGNPSTELDELRLGEMEGDFSLSRYEIRAQSSNHVAEYLNTMFREDGYTFTAALNTMGDIDHMVCEGPVEGRDDLLKRSYGVQCGVGWKVRADLNFNRSTTGRMISGRHPIRTRPLPDRKAFLIRFADGQGPVDEQPKTVHRAVLARFGIHIPVTEGEHIEVDYNGYPVEGVEWPDRERLSRRPREVNVITDPRYGAFAPS